MLDIRSIVQMIFLDQLYAIFYQLCVLKNDRTDRLHAKTEANKKHIKNLSNIELTNDQTNLLAKSLKFIPTPKEKEILTGIS